MAIIKMGGGQAVNVIGNPDGVGPVSAKGPKWSGGFGIAIVVVILGATFRAGLLLVTTIVVIPGPTSAVERQLVFRDVALVEVGRISRSCTAVDQTVMPPGVGAAGAASHGGDEKMRWVSCVER